MRLSTEPLATALLLTTVGTLLAVSVLFGIEFEDYALRLGTAALVLILMDGGLNTSRAALTGALGPAAAPASRAGAGFGRVLDRRDGGVRGFEERRSAAKGPGSPEAGGRALRGAPGRGSGMLVAFAVSRARSRLCGMRWATGRGAELIAPRGSTVLQPGDHVYVLARPDDLPWLRLLFGRPDEDV